MLREAIPTPPVALAGLGPLKAAIGMANSTWVNRAPTQGEEPQLLSSGSPGGLWARPLAKVGGRGRTGWLACPQSGKTRSSLSTAVCQAWCSATDVLGSKVGQGRSPGASVRARGTVS